MKTITAYRCEFHPQAKVMVTERAMTAHEAQCVHNTANKACPTCEHDTYGLVCFASVRPAGVKLVRDCASWALRESRE